MKDIAGKTAFVTGAASGIGLGIAFAQAGAKVMLCDIDEAALRPAPWPRSAGKGLRPDDSHVL